MNESEVAKIGAVGSEPVKGFTFDPPAAKAQVPKQKQPAVEKAAPAIPPSLGEIRLSFRVDGASNDVVITVMDKASGHVIRTIPFDAMKDLPIGDLFQYSQ